MLVRPDQKPATSLATDQTSISHPTLSLSAVCNVKVHAESVHTEPRTRSAVMFPDTVDDTLPLIMRRRWTEDERESIDRAHIQCAEFSNCDICCTELGDVRYVDWREVLNCRGFLDGDPGVRQACTSNVLLCIFRCVRWDFFAAVDVAYVEFELGVVAIISYIPMTERSGFLAVLGNSHCQNVLSAPQSLDQSPPSSLDPAASRTDSLVPLPDRWC